MLPDKYKLDITEHNKILDKIRKFLFLDKKSVQNPQIYILGGQPGAGKSVLTQRVLLSGGDDNFVSINGDEFRTLPPQAKEIFQNHDKDIARAITVEREKPLSSQDIKDLSSDIDGLLLKMTARNENLVYIEDLKSLKEQIVAKSDNKFSYKNNIGKEI